MGYPVVEQLFPKNEMLNLFRIKTSKSTTTYDDKNHTTTLNPKINKKAFLLILKRYHKI